MFQAGVSNNGARIKQCITFYLGSAYVYIEIIIFDVIYKIVN